MVPLQTIFLLILVGTQDLYPPIQPNSAWPNAGYALLSLITSHLILILFVSYRTRTALRLLHLSTTDTSNLTYRMERLYSNARWASVIITGIHLFAFNLFKSLEALFAHTYFLRHLYIAQAILIAPAILSWFAFWTSAYQLESASRQRSLPFRLAQGFPVYDMPPLSRFLTMQARHSLFPIVPVALYAFILKVGELCEGLWSHALDAASILASILMLLLTPWLITRIWSTVPLTGPLRARLDAVAASYRLRFRNILLWKTHNVITNAAILGYLPFARYFFMTDALLESLTDRQLEAVFAHEVGHGVHRHLPWYLAAFIGTLALSAGITELSRSLMHLQMPDGPLSPIEFIPWAFLALFMAFGFPFFSHRFEHQADWFAARHMARSLSQQPAPTPIATVLDLPGADLQSAEVFPTASTPAENITLEQYATGQYPHAQPASQASVLPPAEPTPPPALSLTPIEQPANFANLTISPDYAAAGAEVFISALNTLVEATHRTRNRKGWMHPSINGRINLLRRLSADPAAAKTFEHKMRTTRLLILALFILGICSVVLAALQPDSPEPPATSPATTTASTTQR